jgi:4-aminobutyrate aminotransferase
VSRAVSTPPIVVTGAAGARVEADDGRSYIDFAGGIGCQNLGHGDAAVVRAIHEQVDRYLHQCFMVGTYEPYVEVCRRLAELYPGEGEYKSVLLNSGAEAVENAVKIARAATGRPAVIAFDRAFHGRTLLTMSLTSKVAPYKQGFGPFAPEVYRAPAPYEYRGIASDDAIRALEQLFKAHVDPHTVACVVLEPVQGEGGFIPMPLDFPRRLHELCHAHGILYVDDEVQAGVGRTGPVWAIEHYGVEPDLLVSG